ncbi:VRR-NUC domain-containing protein [Eubacteriales bacterium OttesenSCG-928-A19]|nr:VRR-NUC domain-containing protein [Eubacteriales bacterium OttesenSCG-928-A19]
MLERDLIAQIKRYLASLGGDVFYFKEHGGPYGASGVPDIIACYKGRFLGLEAKLPNGRLTELQRRSIEKINGAGGIARRVEGVDDVKAVVQQVDAERPSALKSPLVFVCSPYRGDMEANERRAEGYCRFVYDQQCIPFAPHLLFTRFLDDTEAADRDTGITMGIEMLKLCDELWAFGTPTTGMLCEMEAATQMDKRVCRFDENCREVAL